MNTLFRLRASNANAPANSPMRGNVFTVFIEAESHGRALANAVQLLSRIWSCRLSDVTLHGLVASEAELIERSADHLPHSHRLFALSSSLDDAHFDLPYCRPVETVLLVGQEWHARLTQAHHVVLKGWADAWMGSDEATMPGAPA